MSRLTTARQLIYMTDKGRLCQSDRVALENVESCIKCGYVSQGQLQALEMLYRRSTIKIPGIPAKTPEQPIAPVEPTIDQGEISLIPRARGRLSAEARRAWALEKNEQATREALKDKRYVKMAHSEMEKKRAETKAMLNSKKLTR